MRELYKWMVIVLLPITLFSQTEKWVYQYSSPSSGFSKSNSIVYGLDKNIYVAGRSIGVNSKYDFIVISLTPLGDTNWTYRYNGPGNGWDEALSIAYGSDGNIYVAGESNFSSSKSGRIITLVNDFTVISLNTKGLERWVYKFNGADYKRDRAYSIDCGKDGNIYSAGSSSIISLSADGEELWIYPYSGSGDILKYAKTLVCDMDNNIYVAGPKTVISLTSTGDTNWTYTYDELGSDMSHAITYGLDGNIYVAGKNIRDGFGSNIVIRSFNTKGTLNWVYTYEGPGADRATSIIYGPDSLIYVAGVSSNCTTHADFIVLSLTTTGDLNWIFRHTTQGGDVANAITYGVDGNIYAAGSSNGDGLVISLTSEGKVNWIHTYNGVENGRDIFSSLVYALDGNLYVTGESEVKWPKSDFIVVCIDPEENIE